MEGELHMEKKLSQEGIDLINQVAKMTVDIAKLESETEIEKEDKK